MQTQDVNKATADRGVDIMVHTHAIVESTAIGEGTRIWAFAHVLPGAVIGAQCNICDHVFVENDVTIGDNVTVKCGVQLWDGVSLEDSVFIGPNATFTNDPFPRSKAYPHAYARTLVRRGASVGANATILPGITIGAGAMVGAGAVVTKDVPPNAIVTGSPARIVGYTYTPSALRSPSEQVEQSEFPSLGVGNANLHRMPRVTDLRGSLSFAELGAHLPFSPKRYFVVYGVQSEQVRGEHAHRALHQFLVCVAGACSVVLDDGTSRREVRLDDPTIGLHVPPMVWAVQYKFSSDAVLMVLASDVYDAADYVRDYDTFIALVGDKR